MKINQIAEKLFFLIGKLTSLPLLKLIINL
jgi:hypothetical protein